MNERGNQTKPNQNIENKRRKGEQAILAVARVAHWQCNKGEWGLRKWDRISIADIGVDLTQLVLGVAGLRMGNVTRVSGGCADGTGLASLLSEHDGHFVLAQAPPSPQGTSPGTGPLPSTADMSFAPESISPSALAMPPSSFASRARGGDEGPAASGVPAPHMSPDGVPGGAGEPAPTGEPGPQAGARKLTDGTGPGPPPPPRHLSRFYTARSDISVGQPGDGKLESPPSGDGSLEGQAEGIHSRHQAGPPAGSATSSGDLGTAEGTEGDRHEPNASLGESEADAAQIGSLPAAADGMLGTKTPNTSTSTENGRTEPSSSGQGSAHSVGTRGSGSQDGPVALHTGEAQHVRTWKPGHRRAPPASPFASSNNVGADCLDSSDAHVSGHTQRPSSEGEHAGRTADTDG
jgi:hypothetical protein